jgi:hypothetical protein
MRKRQAEAEFNSFESLAVWFGTPTTDYSRAMQQRQQDAKVVYLTTERLSAEPRGNEVDLRRKS